MNTLLEQNNYLFVPQFISEKKAKALAKQFEAYAEEKELCGDSQAPNSRSMYNYPAFLELLCNRLHKVSDIVEEKLLPTYTYARVYKPGDDLKVHKDRDACELSLTVNLYQEKEWPIYVKKPNGETAQVTLHPGDAMIYLGCAAEHWRETLNEGKNIQVFLHYVFSRGHRAYAVFDKERTPGFQTHSDNKILGRHRSNLADYIIHKPGYIPIDLCNDILAEYKDTQEWVQTRVGNTDVGEEQPHVRGAKAIAMSREETICINREVRLALDARLLDCVRAAMMEYRQLFPDCVIQEDTGYELLRYNVGEGYTQHTDNFRDAGRAVSCSICLNDEYEGGEFTFFNGALSFKQKAGDILFFPSSFQYPHQVNKVTSGTRYAIVTWLR
jgi:predicted 2-oxoglutarate/Fe(II)-dependent dioxygenase YbiX/alkylated DNA repair dioxygenase AlkB